MREFFKWPSAGCLLPFLLLFRLDDNLFFPILLANQNEFVTKNEVVLADEGKQYATAVKEREDDTDEINIDAITEDARDAAEIHDIESLEKEEEQ